MRSSNTTGFISLASLQARLALTVVRLRLLCGHDTARVMKQGVDEFLAAQLGSMRLRATLEPVSDPAHVKLTPFRSGCACVDGLVIPKAAISAVHTTDAEHYCCGKLLRIAVVEFNEDSRALYSVLLQILAREGPGNVRSSRRMTRNSKDCEASCADSYQSCLQGCDPRDGNCEYWCKQQLHRCLQGCQEPVPPPPTENIATESCNITVTILTLDGEVENSANVSNELILSPDPQPVRDASMNPFAIVGRDGTTTLTPMTGVYVRDTGEVSFSAWFKIEGKYPAAPVRVWVTTGAVTSPSGKYDTSGATLDQNTRELSLVAAGALDFGLGPFDFLIAIVATLSALPSK
jgi:hypothetical protein